MNTKYLTPDLEIKMSTLNKLIGLAKEFNMIVDGISYECGVKKQVAVKVFKVPPMAAEVVSITSEIAGLDITKKAQYIPFVTARCAAAYVLKKHCRLSYESIGRMLGNRNHATIMNNVREAEERLRNDVPEFREMVTAIEERLFNQKLKIAS